MKNLFYLVIVTIVSQGGHSQSVRNQDQLPTVEYGSTCKMIRTSDSPPFSSCRLNTQEMLGAFCSCTTANGIINGTVVQ